MLYRAFFSLTLLIAFGGALIVSGGSGSPQAGAIPRATNTNTPTSAPLPTGQGVTPEPYPAPVDGATLAERVRQFSWDELPLFFSAFGAPGLPAGQWYLWLRAAPGALSATFSAPVSIAYQSPGVTCAADAAGLTVICQVAAEAAQPSGVLLRTAFDVRAVAQLTTNAGVETATWPRPPLTPTPAPPAPSPTATPAPLPVRLIAIPIFNGSNGSR